MERLFVLVTIRNHKDEQVDYVNNSKNIVLPTFITSAHINL